MRDSSILVTPSHGFYWFSTEHISNVFVFGMCVAIRWRYRNFPCVSSAILANARLVASQKPDHRWWWNSFTHITDTLFWHPSSSVCNKHLQTRGGTTLTSFNLQPWRCVRACARPVILKINLFNCCYLVEQRRIQHGESPKHYRA